MAGKKGPKFNVVVLKYGDGAYVRLVGANGEILFMSEVYESEENAKRAVEDIVLAVTAIIEGRNQSSRKSALFTVERQS